MRNISFFITKKQFKNRTKDVTRRLGWLFLKEGDILMGVEKCQGLKKGDKIKKLGAIEIVYVNREPLSAITQSEVYREGFTIKRTEFIQMFCSTHKGCTPETIITRIQYKYL